MGLISRQKLEKERNRMMRSERKRLRCPTLRSGSLVVASKTFTLKGAGSHPLGNYKLFHWYFYHFVYFQTKGSWFEFSKYQYRSGGPCLCTVQYLSLFCVYCRGLEPGAFKVVKISLKKLKHSGRSDSVSFREDVQDDATELKDSIL